MAGAVSAAALLQDTQILATELDDDQQPEGWDDRSRSSRDVGRGFADAMQAADVHMEESSAREAFLLEMSGIIEEVAKGASLTTAETKQICEVVAEFTKAVHTMIR